VNLGHGLQEIPGNNNREGEPDRGQQFRLNCIGQSDRTAEIDVNTESMYSEIGISDRLDQKHCGKIPRSAQEIASDVACCLPPGGPHSQAMGPPAGHFVAEHNDRSAGHPAGEEDCAAAFSQRGHHGAHAGKPGAENGSAADAVRLQRRTSACAGSTELLNRRRSNGCFPCIDNLPAFVRSRAIRRAAEDVFDQGSRHFGTAQR
jgi:hypothetical protein